MTKPSLPAGCLLILALGCGCTATISEGDPADTSAAPGPAGSGSPGVGGAPAGGTGAAAQGGVAPTAAGSGGSTGTATSGGSAGTTTVATGGSGGVPPVFENPPTYQPAAGMLRRLTRAQFRNAMRDVFGVEVDVSQIDPDSYNGDMAVIGASTVATPELGVEQYQTAIEGAVDAVFADTAKRSAFIGCTLAAADDACVRGFIQDMGRRAWRRPLESAEVDRLIGVSQTGATELGSPIEGVHWATVALLASPNFLYRAELGAPSTTGALRFTGYEMASRLAFLLWNSLPDEALLDAAGSGQLSTGDGIRAQAERLLGTTAGRESVGNFAEEYFRLDRIATQAKDGSEFPEYTPALQAGMVRDLRGTWEVIALDDQTSALDVFSTPKVVVNSDLAQLYGLDATGLTSTTFEVRSLPADGTRIGLLSKAGFLSEFANQKHGSPTLRGKFMRESLLCTHIDPPPGNVNQTIEDPPADQPMTRRQQLELHRESAVCAGCHSLMDPLGLPLESFDAIGRFRATELGLPIDPSGDFDGQPVADARELGVAVGSSTAVAQCVVRKYYAYAMGYTERDLDQSVINALADSFLASGFKLRELILDVVTSDAFSSVAPQP